MSDGVLIALIVTVGAGLTAIGWKLLDIGKRAVELGHDHDHGGHRATRSAAAREATGRGSTD